MCELGGNGFCGLLTGFVSFWHHFRRVRVHTRRRIANAGGGACIIVPGNASIEAMQAELLAAFSQIAANVPPPKLIHETEE